MITKYNTHKEQNNLCNESLRDKMKGKSEVEVDDGIDNLIKDVVSSLHGWGDIKDYQKGIKYIHDNYLKKIKKLVSIGWDYDDIKDLIINNVTDNLIDEEINI